eukprot:TRINITY_DN1397_c0_g1_i1.p1 TRINITY_DN1397_c0_g1~~TRINITY_DN1397_c0_g1_i1.p1  ORF type:complete len:167 (-),score=24.98 TRINITY_DN1397_c0_g1_i1:106-606(-)
MQTNPSDVILTERQNSNLRLAKYTGICANLALAGLTALIFFLRWFSGTDPNKAYYFGLMSLNAISAVCWFLPVFSEKIRAGISFLFSSLVPIITMALYGSSYTRLLDYAIELFLLAIFGYFIPPFCSMAFIFLLRKHERSEIPSEEDSSAVLCQNPPPSYEKLEVV